MKPTSFARYMSSYLTEYLPGIKGVSHNTISSKRDAYILLYPLRINVKNPGRVETRTVNVGNRGKPR